MESKIERFKKHVSENKKVYIASGVSLAIGCNPGELSKHLRNLTGPIKGFSFEKLAEI